MKILIACIAIMCLCSVGQAADSGGAQWGNDLGPWAGYFRDTVAKHKHPTRDNPVGIGLDLILYENKKVLLEPQLVVESKYDFVNEEAAVFGVVKVNLWKFFKGK